jgi:hypothetical protein
MALWHTPPRTGPRSAARSAACVAQRVLHWEVEGTLASPVQRRHCGPAGSCRRRPPEGMPMPKPPQTRLLAEQRRGLRSPPLRRAPPLPLRWLRAQGWGLAVQRLQRRRRAALFCSAQRPRASAVALAQHVCQTRALHSMALYTCALAWLVCDALQRRHTPGQVAARDRTWAQVAVCTGGGIVIVVCAAHAVAAGYVRRLPQVHMRPTAPLELPSFSRARAPPACHPVNCSHGPR